MSLQVACGTSIVDESIASTAIGVAMASTSFSFVLLSIYCS